MTANAIFLIIFFSAVAFIVIATAIFAFVKYLAWRRDPRAFEENLRRDAREEAEREQRLKDAEKERIRAGRASWMGMFFGFLMLAFGLFALFTAIRSGYDLARMQTWNAADCTVLEIRAERHTSTKSATTYTPKILYEYEFGGARFTGDRFDAVGNTFESETINDTLKPFSRGTNFICFVNPRAPSESVASRSVWQFPVLRYSFGLLIGFGFAALILANSLPRSSKKKAL